MGNLLGKEAARGGFEGAGSSAGDPQRRTGPAELREKALQAWKKTQGKGNPRYFLSEENKDVLLDLIDSVYSVLQGRHNRNNILLVGRRGVGKTTLLCSLLEALSAIEFGGKQIVSVYVDCAERWELPSEALWRKVKSLGIKTSEDGEGEGTRDISVVLDLLYEKSYIPVVVVDEIQDLYVKVGETDHERLRRSRLFVEQIYSIGESKNALGWLTGSSRLVTILAFQRDTFSNILGGYVQYPSLNDTKYNVHRLYALRKKGEVGKLVETLTGKPPFAAQVDRIFHATGGVVGKIAVFVEKKGQDRVRLPNCENFTDVHWDILECLLYKYASRLPDQDFWDLEPVTEGELTLWLKRFPLQGPDHVAMTDAKVKLVDDELLEQAEGTYNPNAQYLAQAPKLLTYNRHTFQGLTYQLGHSHDIGFLLEKVRDRVDRIEQLQLFRHQANNLFTSVLLAFVYVASYGDDDVEWGFQPSRSSQRDCDEVQVHTKSGSFHLHIYDSDELAAMAEPVSDNDPNTMYLVVSPRTTRTGSTWAWRSSSSRKKRRSQPNEDRGGPSTPTRRPRLRNRDNDRGSTPSGYCSDENMDE
uniref:AAA+ ATPase domain-containing protein n=1 Tax=Branchiostoma floridae TaxID=7739 RepID=C3Z4W1_BRAFL|eukprot:XP_002596306.1 hypothetical protein BRAFLDRAFT_123068 [Branchiostoma floridae]